ncbi:MAG: phenylalanine--tRNA ligase subunit beta [Clostridia bacterium]|nr:phenylalanine--tRNA ligase subunit beta [Clostridia bacterium]
MLVPMNWLSDYVDIQLDPHELAERLTMTGAKVEAVRMIGANLRRIRAGRVLSATPHPSSGRLRVVLLDLGAKEAPRRVVTAAANVAEGDVAPVALDGARLDDGTVIGEAELAGVRSEGMLCSARELGISTDASGILLLPPDVAPGADVVEALGLADTVLELEITPNRPDCLCMVGVAREVAAVTGSRLHMPVSEVREADGDAHGLVSVGIEAPDLCRRYAARVVGDVSIAPSPLWMQVRLRAAGVRPISNVVDITNYVMLELNQPLHAFDCTQVHGGGIIVRTAWAGERITTLDDVERELSPEMLVIADSDSALAIAGVMGGAASEISEGTRLVLLESANFARQSVWRTSKSLRLRTEASSRFEKGLDPEIVPAALDRAAALIGQVGAGKPLHGIVDSYPAPATRRFISTSASRISAKLGLALSRENVASCLERLEFPSELGEDGDSMRVEAPSFRGDVREEIDLVEEVARIWGYNNVPARVPAGSMSGGRSPLQRLAQKARQILASAGASETLTIPFMSPLDFDMMRLPSDDLRRNGIAIANPMVDEASLMRTTMVPSMLASIATNVNRRNLGVCLFEIGRVYTPSEALIKGVEIGRGMTPANEKSVLIGGMAGSISEPAWHTPVREYDWFDAKGIVEALLSELGVDGAAFVRSSLPTFHPGRTACVVLGGAPLGVVGQVHPDVAQAYGVPLHTTLFELDFDALATLCEESRYSPLPRFPAIERDVAMLVGREASAAEVVGLIRRVGGELAESAKLFDVYEGPQVGLGKRSLAFSITYRAADRTLTDDEVNVVHNAVRNSLANELGAVLR